MIRPWYKGFGLIDVIVGIALMLTLFLALFGVLRASLILSSLDKAKAAAVEVASTQIEYLRGLSYSSLGTVGGIPAGLVPQNATSTVDGIPYGTRTYIEYYDDPADGTGAADTNGVTTDYKRGKVTVSYSLYGLTRSVTVVSDFVPPSIESSTGGGTLSLHIVGATGANVSDAVVQIVNASTSPTINLTTFSDTSGLVFIGGAATSSQYQIYVSKSGYSSAQTYQRTGTNVNPTPGYLTVAKNQTTSSTFAIDTLATLALSSFTSATTTSFADTFTNASNLALQTNTQVSGGAITLVSPALSGSATSNAITPSYLMGWGLLSATLSQPSGTTALIHVDDPSTNTLIPDSALPGNSAGFSSFPVSLTGISTTTYPSLMLEADLTSNTTTTTSSVLDWSLSYSQGPAPYSNFAFTLTGGKTIGTTGGGLPIYKTTLSDTTGTTGAKNETLEWDAYKITPTTGNIFESCPASPYSLAPAQSLPATLIVGTYTTNTLPIEVETSTGSAIPNAKIVLTKSGYAATGVTSACGFSYFGGLSSATYSASVSATGYTTKSFPSIIVSGRTATSTLVLP